MGTDSAASAGMTALSARTATRARAMHFLIAADWRGASKPIKEGNVCSAAKQRASCFFLRFCTQFRQTWSKTLSRSRARFSCFFFSLLCLKMSSAAR
jgi:hypothetical protein